jgi:hypothetical protein
VTSLRFVDVMFPLARSAKSGTDAKGEPRPSIPGLSRLHLGQSGLGGGSGFASSINARDLGEDRTGGWHGTERALRNLRHSSDLNSNNTRFVDRVLRLLHFVDPCVSRASI